MKSKNKLLYNILQKAAKNPSKIFLPEFDDSRVINASKILKNNGFNIIDFKEILLKKDDYLELISKKKFTINWSDDMKNDFLSSPLNLGLVALENGDVQSVVAGATHSTSEVLRSSIRIVGVNKNSKWVSSTFFMVSPDGQYAFTFADCGVIPDPSSEQLSSIAYESSKFHNFLTNQEPKVAFLSFSTKGSAEHYKVKKIQSAVKIFEKKYPNIIHDGEIQFDVAIDQAVSKRKTNNSLLNGEANVFIFPDLDSANIAYKITQYLGKYIALGPLLQGLNKPIHDLSRGCTEEDIVYVSAISSLQSN